MVRFGLLLGAALLVMGCGDGYTTEEAQVNCDQERAAKASAFTDASYDQCIQCYEECGSLCRAAATTPVSYACISN